VPLEARDRERIEGFLVSGGNRKNEGGSPYADAKREKELVGPLLNYLSQPVSADEMKSTTVPVVTQYFGKKFMSQIVDARNYDERNVESPKGFDKEAPKPLEWAQYPPWPFAFRHGRFWWVFFPNDAGAVTGLMLTGEITRGRPKN
jgi:hypothetical protein